MKIYSIGRKKNSSIINGIFFKSYRKCISNMQSAFELGTAESEAIYQ